jgi:polar amino acid transport system substrate-binding protein
MLRLILTLLIAMALAGCGEKRTSALVVGMELSYPPFEMTDELGNPSGVSVDLAQAMGQELHRPVQIRNMAFDGLIPALKAGEIDCIISSMTATPERAQAVDFSDPYVTTGLGVLLPIGSTVATVADLNRPDQIIAVKKGTTGHLYAVKNLPQAQLLVLDKENAAVLEVVEGKSAAFIYDQMSIYQHWQKNLTTTRALLKPIQEEHWAIAVAPGQDELRQQINAFLAHFRQQGGFDRLGQKYLSQQETAFKQMGVPFVF